MRTIAEMNLLVRARMEVPVGFKLATYEFREGWESIQSEDAVGLKKKMRTSGWNFIKIGDGILKSGIGDTSQEAIAGALKLGSSHDKQTLSRRGSRRDQLDAISMVLSG